MNNTLYRKCNILLLSPREEAEIPEETSYASPKPEQFSARAIEGTSDNMPKDLSKYDPSSKLSGASKAESYYDSQSKLFGGNKSVMSSRAITNTGGSSDRKNVGRQGTTPVTQDSKKKSGCVLS